MRLPRRLLAILSASGLALAGGVAAASPAAPPELEENRPWGQVALTFDDLPGLTLFADQPYVDYFNEMLVRGLKRHHLPAIGFVNESKLDEIQRERQIANLRRWLNAGENLGNHTFSHESPNDLGAAGYIADIARGEPVTRALLAEKHKPLGWFRHPYLETGFPAAAKKQIDDWLAAHGYRVAPVTIDADDWEFAEPYDDAISRHDSARVARIRHQYLAYTERTVEWYQHASQSVFGRQISFVMLLHDTRLNADCIDDLAAILKRRGLKGVTLEEAMKDPAYKLGDPAVTKDGIDWLERWAEHLHRPEPWSTWQDPPKQIEQEYERNNKDRH
ncbi:MAG TPA: polysaccharide deacetylase family protein [Novosphingobium sp.]|nr:polysaccharide deacetylase family protein [Novosphingobium sp.]